MLETLSQTYLSKNDPSFYDIKAKSTQELIANFHAKVNECVKEINGFTEYMAKQMDDFLAADEKSKQEHMTAIRQEYQDFIDIVNLKIMDIENYVKTDLEETAKELLIDSGYFTDELKLLHMEILNSLSALESRMNTFTSLEEGSTTGDAELMDGRTDHFGFPHENIGSHIRTLTKANYPFFNSFKVHNGLINNSNQWVIPVDTTTVNFVLVPVTSGDEVTIKGRNDRVIWYALLKDVTFPIVTNSNANLSDTTTARLGIAVSGTAKLTIPSDTKYLYFLVLDNGSISTPSEVIINGINICTPIINHLEEIYSNFDLLKECMKPPVIACWGDSVTEGVSTADGSLVTYGGENYVSQLYTMLVDNGKNYVLENHGHRLERSVDILGRFKGMYLSEDITIPADNSEVSLGTITAGSGQTSGVIYGSKLHSSLGSDIPTRLYYLSQDTNPLKINGVECTLRIEADSEGYEHGTTLWISKTNNDGKATTLKKGSLLLTNSNRVSDINILYLGINDGHNLSLADWIDRCKRIMEENPKCIILGCTAPIWTLWSDMTGNNSIDYSTYVETARREFGSKFIDLYDLLVSENGINIAIEGGYLSERTVQQIQDDNIAIANKNTPPSLTINGVAGNVHLNAAGYYVIAKLIYDRINEIGWIK